MFSRYLNYLGNRKINVGTRTALQELFQNNFKGINFIAHEDLNPELQAVFITDLPYILNMDFNNIPLAEGYLSALPAEVDSKKLKVGFVGKPAAPVSGQ